jgi:hypothetical protein
LNAAYKLRTTLCCEELLEQRQHDSEANLPLERGSPKFNFIFRKYAGAGGLYQDIALKLRKHFRLSNECQRQIQFKCRLDF